MSTTTSKEADRQWRAERSAARRQRRSERQADRRQRRAQRRAAHRATLVELSHQMRPVVPLLIVTAFAGYGQVSYGVDAYSPTWWPLVARLGIAVGVATGIESIALYVAWHAHDALLNKATLAAARLRRASYLLAFGVATINYSHFSEGWKPTPAAVVFAAFSAIGPWLWGLHTRRAQHMQLMQDGQVDSGGATFAAERKRAFPLRTWGAHRWSIDHGVTDPILAWEGYREYRAQAEPGVLTRAIASAIARRRTASDEQTTIDTPSQPAEQSADPAPPRRRASAAAARGFEVAAAVDEASSDDPGTDEEPEPPGETPEDRVKRLNRNRARRSRKNRRLQSVEEVGPS